MLHARNLPHLLWRRPGRSRSGSGAGCTCLPDGASRICALHDHIAMPLASRRGDALSDGGGDMAGDEICRRGLHVRDIHDDRGR